MRSLALALVLSASTEARSDPAVTTLVVCAPGFPGTAAEAQPRMDRLAAALASAAGWPPGSIAAAYEPVEKAGVERLRGDRHAALALVPLPFYVAHGDALRLHPRMQVKAGATAGEVWTLVAKKGRIRSPADLEPFTIHSLAGYAPGFVRGALRGWGAIPEGTRIVPSRQGLSELRRAGAGEDVAVLLDRAQAEALPTLPFADDLEVVARSAPLPGGLLATVGDRIPPRRWAALERAFTRLSSEGGGAAALADLQMEGFAPLDDAALAAIRRLAAEPPR